MGARACKYTCCIFIIDVQYECVFSFSSMQNNVYNKDFKHINIQYVIYELLKSNCEICIRKLKKYQLVEPI